MINGGRDIPGLHLGSEEQPLALAARQVRVASVASLQQFRLSARTDTAVEAQLVELVHNLPTNETETAGGLLDFVHSSSTAAWAASRRIEEVLRSANSRSPYPSSPLAEKLRVIAQLIGAEMQTRIYYVTLDGFDTHAQQPAAHAALLGQWSDALAAFLDDLAQMGHAERVLTFTFSEFGRRVRENASEGTDHGAAAPVFLAGAAVRPGVYGPHPSLTDLEDGDLRFHTDFRCVYATLLERWLQADSEQVLEGRHSLLPIL